MIDDLICDGRFDARLVRENKSAKGIFITLEIAADDYFAAKLSDVRPGALLKIGYQEIVDVSVQPIVLDPVAQMQSAGPDGVAGGSPAGVAKPKKRFEDYPLSAQCAMRCEDASFRAYMRRRFSTDWAANDFGNTDPGTIVTRVVRDYCGVTSRASLDPDNPAYVAAAAERWAELDATYERHMTDQKYAGARR